MKGTQQSLVCMAFCLIILTQTAQAFQINKRSSLENHFQFQRRNNAQITNKEDKEEDIGAVVVPEDSEEEECDLKCQCLKGMDVCDDICVGVKGICFKDCIQLKDGRAEEYCLDECKWDMCELKATCHDTCGNRYIQCLKGEWAPTDEGDDHDHKGENEYERAVRESLEADAEREQEEKERDQAFDKALEAEPGKFEESVDYSDKPKDE